MGRKYQDPRPEDRWRNAKSDGDRERDAQAPRDDRAARPRPEWSGMGSCGGGSGIYLV